MTQAEKEKFIVEFLNRQIGRIIAKEIVNCERKVNHKEIIKAMTSFLAALYGNIFTEEEVKQFYMDYIAGII